MSLQSFRVRIRLGIRYVQEHHRAAAQEGNKPRQIGIQVAQTFEREDAFLHGQDGPYLSIS